MEVGGFEGGNGGEEGGDEGIRDMGFCGSGRIDVGLALRVRFDDDDFLVGDEFFGGVV